MRIRNGETFYSIGEAAKLIKRSAQTIKGWYAWKDGGHSMEDLPDLPEVYTDFDDKGTRFFKADDIQKLIEFKDNIKYGMMAEFNQKRWGSRGRPKNEEQT